MKYGLTEKEFLFLTKYVIEPLKKRKAQVFIFGSRARGKFEKYSDIDLLYKTETDNKLPRGLVYGLLYKIEESRFPYKVDLVNESDLAKSYRAKIESEKIEL